MHLSREPLIMGDNDHERSEVPRLVLHVERASERASESESESKSKSESESERDRACRNKSTMHPCMRKSNISV